MVVKTWVKQQLLVSQVKCELRAANYNVSSCKVNEGFGKRSLSVSKCSRLKTKKYRIRNCTYPMMLLAGDQDEVEMYLCLVCSLVFYTIVYISDEQTTARGPDTAP